MSGIAIGTRVAFRKTLTTAEQALFTGISGNLGALYVDANRAKAEGAPGMIAFELVLGALATTCLSRIGGPSRRIGRMDLRFLAPVPVGGSVEAAAEVTAAENGALTLRLTGTLDGAGAVMEGEAELLPFRAAA
ncbi:MaoC family dehydratase [Roseomonas populi]|uniref:MaoC family dehydratase n=1 Tax=Roseomonas populi TaxID=3121582 RepID=A0ABT1X391_9PROT|nr:MaoC family dehydratase [Roseomonas pecuniae]MCR0982571.1 MaoC family dehydratase [Roseomonas pecuniae]